METQTGQLKRYKVSNVRPYNNSDFLRPNRRQLPGNKPFLMSRTLLVLVSFWLALAGYPVPARADIVSQCSNTSVTEGQPGVVDCTVVNLGPNLVLINGVFAFAYSLAGDATDNITGVSVIGPNPPVGNPVGFQVLFTTPDDKAEPNPDFGLNDVSLILDAEDAITGSFVPGLYGSAAVGVYDIGLPPETPVTPGPDIPINTPQDFDNTIDIARSRGYVTSIPEPSPIFLLGSALFSLIVLAGKRWV